MGVFGLLSDLVPVNYLRDPAPNSGRPATVGKPSGPPDELRTHAIPLPFSPWISSLPPAPGVGFGGDLISRNTSDQGPSGGPPLPTATMMTKQQIEVSSINKTDRQVGNETDRRFEKQG